MSFFTTIFRKDAGIGLVRILKAMHRYVQLALEKLAWYLDSVCCLEGVGRNGDQDGDAALDGVVKLLCQAGRCQMQNLHGTSEIVDHSQLLLHSIRLQPSSEGRWARLAVIGQTAICMIV